MQRFGAYTKEKNQSWSRVAGEMYSVIFIALKLQSSLLYIIDLKLNNYYMSSLILAKVFNKELRKKNDKPASQQ